MRGRGRPAASSRYLRGRCFWQPSPDDAEQARRGLLRLADRIGRPAVLDPDRRRGRDLPGRARRRAAGVVPVPGSARAPAAPGGRQVLAATSSAASSACPVCALPWPTPPRRRQGFAAAAGFPLVAKLTTPWAKGDGRLRSTSIVATARNSSGRLAGQCRGRRDLDAAGAHPGRARPGLVLPRLLRRASRCRPAFTGREGPFVPGACRADQLRPVSAERRPARPRSPDCCPGCATGASRTWTCAWTPGTASTSCSTSTRGSAPSSGSSGTRQALDVVTACLPGPDRQRDPAGRAGRAAAGSWSRTTTRSQPSATGAAASSAAVAGCRRCGRVDETAWFARDDLRPFGLMCLRMGWRITAVPPGVQTRPRTTWPPRSGRPGQCPAAALRPSPCAGSAR